MTEKMKGGIMCRYEGILCAGGKWNTLGYPFSGLLSIKRRYFTLKARISECKWKQAADPSSCPTRDRSANSNPLGENNLFSSSADLDISAPTDNSRTDAFRGKKKNARLSSITQSSFCFHTHK